MASNDIPRPIVVGFDGSSDSQAALTWAARTASGECPLRVVIAVSDLSRLSEWNREWSEGLANERADVARTMLADLGNPECGFDSIVGPATQVLVEASKDASMVVVGSRGHGRIQHLLLGSVSRHLAQNAACPVVVVREPKSSDATRIVVGVDGSDDSIAAMRFALERGQATGAPVSVVHGFQWTSGPDDALRDDRVRKQASVIAQSDVTNWLTDVTKEFPDVVVDERVVSTSARQALCEESKSAALVVVGARGTGAFQGMLLGSVSDYVLDHASCPVVVIR